MNLYHLTAIPATAISAIAQGSFSAPRQYELIVSTGTSLELYRLVPKQKRLLPLFRTELFAQIRAIASFRLPATRRDYLVVTSDSGSLTVLSPDVLSATFRQVHCEPFGRSGCRRVVPGQFLTCEPRGRACMIAAVERAKFAYVLNRDAQDNLTISSPLEAHKSSCVTYAMHALDVGFDNPVFAALERPYEENAVKLLVYYELDLGLNTVVRKLTSPVRPSSFVLLPVPGHTDGPGGVLVCSAGYVTYRSLFDEEDTMQRTAANGTHPNGNVSPPSFLETAIPFREGTDSSSTMIVSGTAYHDRKGNAFFFMLSTELGDLIKAELSWTPNDGATELRLVYFDSLPAPVLAMTIFRSGFLFVALEGSDALLLKFKAVDVPDNDPAGGLSISSQQQVDELSSTYTDASHGVVHAVNPNDLTNGALTPTSTLTAQQTYTNLAGKPFFARKPKLSHLSVEATLESLAPILNMSNATDMDGESLMLSTGRGQAASVRGIRRGISVIEMSSPHALSSRITNVFTFKERADDAHHRFIVVSFRDRTKVLIVGDARVEETFTSGFELSVSTIYGGQISRDSFVQIHASGVRFIPGGRVDEATEWIPPVPSRIVAGCCNKGQAVVALSSGTVVYFEIDAERDRLMEMDKISNALVPSGGDGTVSLGAGDEGTTPTVAIPEVPPGRQRAFFFAVGDGASSKVRLYRIGLDGSAEALGIHVAPAPIESIALVDFGIRTKDDSPGSGTKAFGVEDSASYKAFLSLVIGTKHGAVVRVSVDETTGKLGDKRSMFLGPEHVHLRHATMGGVTTCFALGSKPYMMFAQGGRIEVSPMTTESMQHVASLSSEEFPGGFVAAHGAKLRLLCVDLLHALQAGADMPIPSPASALPAPTTLGCLFQTTRTRASATIRRVVRVAEKDAGFNTNRRDSGGKKRPRTPGLFVVLESDHRVVNAHPVRDAHREATTGKSKKRVEVNTSGLGNWFSRMTLVRTLSVVSADEMDEEDIELDGSDPLVSFSTEAVSILDSVTLEDIHDCILCATSTSSFTPAENEVDTISYVVVSHARNLVVSATSPDSARERRRMEEEGNKSFGMLRVYRIDKEFKLRLVHETRIAEPAFAMAAFRDMVAVGAGNAVRLYSLGKRQLLRKVEYRAAVQNRVCAIAVTGGDRLFVADKQESVTLFKYMKGRTDGATPNGINGGATVANVRMDEIREGGRLVAIASDEVARWVTCLHALDYATVCGGDMFGNVFVLRLPEEVAPGAEQLATAGVPRSGALCGAACAPHGLRVEACVHVGAGVTCVTEARINASASTPLVGSDSITNESAIIYGTMNGAVGVIMPFATTTDAEFARKLEMIMQKGWRSPVGRDHLSFRSSFYTTRSIIDGDFCEMFVAAKIEQKEAWAKSVGRSVHDIVRKLDELHASVV